MDILVPDEWLRTFVKSSVTPKKLAEYLSLCGPSVEKIEKTGKTFVYSIEVTTNRVDTASIFGIARETSAILPQFGIECRLVKPMPVKELKAKARVSFLNVTVDKSLCPHFSAVLIKNVKIKESPYWMRERLSWVGERSINNVVDISNYIMHEIGQPVHTFDYDKIGKAKMILRKSKKGERITTLDNQTYTLPGGDIVIEDGDGRLIDLAGIMGGKNSAVDKYSKNVLLFVQTYNPVNIRRTAMRLAKRTEASFLFEKGLDTELVNLGVSRGVKLFEKLTQAKAEKDILDIYPNPYKPKIIKTSLPFIVKLLGMSITKTQVDNILTSLEFGTKWQGELLNVLVPSFRAGDVKLAEDIVEEVARLYGYFRLDSKLMSGRLPEPIDNPPFDFENLVRNTLSGWGGNEVYTLSMVGKDKAGKNALGLVNPLGEGSAFMRTSLMPSLIEAAKSNSGEKEPFHLFEIANVYLPKRQELPLEKVILAGIFSNYTYRQAKGIIEAFLEKINITYILETEDSQKFQPSKRILFKHNNTTLGSFGVTDENFIYYEFEIDKLQSYFKAFPSFKPIPKYPPQIEDITFTFPNKTKVSDVISLIKSIDKQIRQVSLIDIYKGAYTIRICYQNRQKTLRNDEVESIRKKILIGLRKRFGVMQKV